MASHNLYDPCMHCYEIAVLVTHVVRVSAVDASSDTLHNRARKIKLEFQLVLWASRSHILLSRGLNSCSS